MIGDIPMRKFESRIRDRAIIAAMLDMIPIVHVGIHDGDWPYVVPMSFGYEITEDRLLVYLHCAREGHKVDLWRKDPRVSLTFSVFHNRPNDPYRDSIHDYRSVMANGLIRQLVRGESGSGHGRGVQAILRHNGRRPNQFSVPHYLFMDVYVVECSWENVTAKSEEPIRNLSEVPFPTREELQNSDLSPFDYDDAFTRKDYPSVPMLSAGLSADFPTANISKNIDIRIGALNRELQLSFRWSCDATMLDCDLSALVLDRNGKLPRRYDIAFYNQPADRSGAVCHQGDDILGIRGREQLTIHPNRLPDWCGEVTLLLSVYHAKERQQHLGMLDGLLLTAEGPELAEQLVCSVDTGTWQGKAAAVVARLLRQPTGDWCLTGSDGRCWEDWRLTSIFPDYHLPQWRE